MTDPPFDLSQAHRWFAVECNNRAWDLIEKLDRTDEETQKMIHSAHTAYWHWRKVGTEINALRALCLLAFAYLAADYTRSAAIYAERAVALSERLGDRQSAFDRASIYAAAALAHRNEAVVYQELAEQFAAQLKDEEERNLFEKLYRSRQ